MFLSWTNDMIRYLQFGDMNLKNHEKNKQTCKRMTNKTTEIRKLT